jgi:predicted GTPase
MSGQTFADLKSGLRAALDQLSELLEERDSPSLAQAVRDLAGKLADERFNVVVVGEFKRGKTSFVNALLGAQLLPAAVVPLTSIVTAVTWGEHVGAEVSFLDGRIQRIPIEDLPSYVTERGNPENRLCVDRVVVSYPSPVLSDGVYLVDTPGVGSVYRHNTDAAYAFVPEADAAIFLATADPPISETERDFLTHVRSEAARMFFVLNKIDYLCDEDLAETRDFTRSVVAAAIGHEAVLYAISAKRALEAKRRKDEQALEASGLGAFERDFRAFLLHDKGGAIITSVAGGAQIGRASCRERV